MPQLPHLQHCDDSARFAQGDIICSIGPDWAATEEEIYLIVTADCDIANSKMGEYYSVLPVVTARHYLNDIWARDEGERIRSKATSSLRALLLSQNSGAGAKLELSPERLIEWITADGGAQLLQSALVRGSSKESDISKLVSLVSDASSLLAISNDRLKCLFDIKRRDNPKLDAKKIILDALSPRGMRLEYLFVPGLPNGSDIGYVILLREIRPVKVALVHSTSLDARLSGDHSGIFVRQGRFADYLRFSVAQRLANLWSRIGMTDEYEDDTTAAIELIAERYR